MNIEILDEAQEDLVQGFRFYESQEPGTGLPISWIACSRTSIHFLCLQGFTQ